MTSWQAGLETRWWLMLVVLTLAACGSATSTQSAVDLGNAAAVHQAFVAALQSNDRAAVVALTVDEQQAARADTWLQMITAYRDSTATAGAYMTGGALIAVAVDAPAQQGAGMEGRSRWQYPRRTLCYHTELAQTATGWCVAAFNVTTEACA